LKDIKNIIENHWSKKNKNTNLKLRWWQSGLIIRHINKIVCGEEISGFSQGLIELTRSMASHQLPFNRGISIGGGAGQKEMNLLRHGIVKTFDIYEYSKERIEIGMNIAKKQSLEEKINFIYGDAFDLIIPNEQYDFIHWNNSLHHMLDVDKAVEWSKNVLRLGGLFFMDDFIGPSRFQWPDEQIDFATKIRKIFGGSKYLKNPKTGLGFLATSTSRPDINKLIDTDPSEAADSGNIVAAIFKHFPKTQFKATGGIVYNLVLNDMLNNFDEDEDKIILDLLMVIDKLCLQLGQTHYGVALAFKER